MKAHDQKLLPIGYLGRAHGIRGELTFTITAEDTGLALGEVWLKPRGDGPIRPHVIERLRAHHGSWLATLKGVSDRNGAEELKSHAVLVDEKRLPPLADGEIWLKDLPGLRVIVEDESGARELGRITEADAPAGQEIWTIITPDGKEVLFPAVEEFVLSISLEKGEARIAPPPGLLALYLEES